MLVKLPKLFPQKIADKIQCGFSAIKRPLLHHNCKLPRSPLLSPFAKLNSVEIRSSAKNKARNEIEMANAKANFRTRNVILRPGYLWASISITRSQYGQFPLFSKLTQVLHYHGCNSLSRAKELYFNIKRLASSSKLDENVLLTATTDSTKRRQNFFSTSTHRSVSPR